MHSVYSSSCFWFASWNIVTSGEISAPCKSSRSPLFLFHIFLFTFQMFHILASKKHFIYSVRQHLKLQLYRSHWFCLTVDYRWKSQRRLTLNMISETPVFVNGHLSVIPTVCTQLTYCQVQLSNIFQTLALLKIMLSGSRLKWK